MLGSTAVAKQLLREIADKLISDGTAPEALFAILGDEGLGSASRFGSDIIIVTDGNVLNMSQALTSKECKYQI